MGAVTFSIDDRLAVKLVQSLGLEVFVETGTYKGDTLAVMRPHFESLFSCDLSPALSNAARHRFEGDDRIHLSCCGSPAFLVGLPFDKRDARCLYWLDAHWCSGENTAGEASQCPLLEEIDAIGELNGSSVLWIDDARYFLAPPPKPLVCEGWPMFTDLMVRLLALAGSTHRMIVVNDTILVYPVTVEPLVRDYAWEHGIDWLACARKAKQQHAQSKTKKKRSKLRKLLSRWKG